ncbi:cytochrome c biogenesis CcdA family protein [Nocardioides perillae]|uniref:Cytochrome c-type biogenesis protein n=1 Tax=Nocardioides perillae TaxID=1119534 RepID=A0A7Y9RS38_9ACTN|nr:cytochrome c biogenesis protein CcdA [Nocardioides perillae]NYG55330.1 cytochrome c-type biogenesis protein [Nocardioides perillae]
MSAATLAEGVQELVFEGPLILAGLVAVAAGLLSFFSPCCLPLVPGYLSYVGGLAGQDVPSVDDAARGVSVPAAAGGAAAGRCRDTSPLGSGGVQAAGRRRRGRATTGAVLFVAGFAAVFTGYGALFGSLGALLFEHQETLTRILGAMTILFGLVFSGVLWRLPWLNRTARINRRPPDGLAGAPLVGALFGLGWTPCIGPTLAAVLSLATSSADAGRGAALSFAYSAGLGIPFILVAAGMQRFMGSVAWARRHARAVTATGGFMLVLLGLLQVTGLWTALISRMQGLIAGWQPPM